MSPGNPKFIRRQKEIARAQHQRQKREEKAARRAQRADGSVDDGVAEIQAALDAGLNPGAPEAGLDPAAPDTRKDDEEP